MPMPDYTQTLPDGINTCVLEDIQLRRKTVSCANNTMNPGLTTTTTTTGRGNTSSPLLDKGISEALDQEQAALRIALDLSREQQKQEETERRAWLEQTRLEAAYREQQQWRSTEAERREKMEKERRMEEEALRAAAAAAYRVQKKEEEEQKKEHERVVREQLARERELKLQAELERMRVKAEEKERLLTREAAAALKLKVQREQVQEMRKEMEELVQQRQQLEEAAIARAIEESILTETTRKLVVDEEEERRRRAVEAVKERVRREAEAKALEERLRKRVGGGTKKGPGGLFGGLGFSSLGGARVGDVRAFAVHGDGAKAAAYHRTSGPYISTAYARGNMGLPDTLPESTWYDHTPRPAPAPRHDNRLKNHFNGLDHWDCGLGPGHDGVWRKTTTERWETVIEHEGHDGCRRCKEGSKPTRDFL